MRPNYTLKLEQFNAAILAATLETSFRVSRDTSGTAIIRVRAIGELRL
jgi:hypothetical protein